MASWYHPPDSTLPQKNPTGVGSNLDESQFQLTFWDFIIWIGAQFDIKWPLSTGHCGLMILCQGAHLQSCVFQMNPWDIMKKIQ